MEITETWEFCVNDKKIEEIWAQSLNVLYNLKGTIEV